MNLPKDVRDEITGIDITYDAHTSSVLVAVEFGDFQILEAVSCSGVLAGNSNPNDVVARIIKAFASRPDQYRKPSRKVFG